MRKSIGFPAEAAARNGTLTNHKPFTFERDFDKKFKSAELAGWHSRPVSARVPGVDIGSFPGQPRRVGKIPVKNPGGKK
jgi:hypothetical protein